MTELIKAEATSASDVLQKSYDTWAKTQDNKNMSVMLRNADPVIRAGLKTYAGRGATDDPILRLTATRLVRNAIPTYKPASKVKLSTYLMHHLKGLTRATHQRAQSLDIPRMAWYDLKNVSSAQEEFTTQYDREPSGAELADITGLSMRRIAYLDKFRKAGIPESVLRTSNPNEFIAPTEEAEDTFWPEAVYKSISPRDQLIFDYRLGAHGREKLTNEIGRAHV